MFISWIGEADQICSMNIRKIGSLHGIAYLKKQLDAPIYWRYKSYEQHFIPALPICLDNSY